MKLSLKLLIFWVLTGMAISCQNAPKPMFQNPVVEKVWDGFIFVEGPVWVEGKGVLFSDIPANKVYLFGIDSSLSVYLDTSGNSNGLVLDAEGNLILCQHGYRQVAQLMENGEFKSLAAKYNGMQLNSPNDIAIKSDGSMFFTDPPYGLYDKRLTSDLGFNGIYRLSPEGEVQLLDKTLNRPNGIAFSPDESKLYVGDSEGNAIYMWDVIDDTSIANKTVFDSIAAPGFDGMKVDANGFIYSSGPEGIWIWAPDGTHQLTIPIPGQTTNCAFGDPDGKTLYVTSGNALYRIREGE
ncbi:MAG: SMP-30/gluconolactonase/LRE family protein [Bacteroidales bacterium]|nr:SMP-30/gluconolactonase/LRE family protein [Bacteroidales bacterium]MBN2820767.1 SMP-30/gluconolactonase/LRE family protein [Bacteroidales bacterium]